MKASNNRQETKHRKILRIICAVLMFCAAVSLLGDLAAWLVYLLDGISFPVWKAATIGIIGGADGPTAVFITSSIVPVWHTILKLLLLAISLFVWRHLNSRSGKGEE